MGKLGPRALALLLAALAMFTVAACGGDDEGDGGGGEGKQGGSINIGMVSQPDFLDPASAYTVNAWESQWQVYTPPYTYKREEGEAGTEIIPGLAQELPKISNGGKTYEFTIRKGIKYSDGSPVKASDFEHTVKRVLIQESGGSGFFLGIEGAEAYADAGKEQGDISGIETDDQTGKVTIRLGEPDGTFLNVLATNFSGMVPGDTSFEILSKNPPPGVGPYKYTKSVPNREFVMQKNDLFNLPGIPKGNVDTITTKIIKNQDRVTQDVINGQLDYSHDPPTADLLPEVRSKYKDRYREFEVADVRYFWMNERVKPFDNEKVRQAVNYAIDKRAISRLYGGQLEPSCNFLPPAMQGYEGRPDSSARRGEGAAADRGVRREGHRGHGLGQYRQPDSEDDRVLRGRPQQDRFEGDAEDRRRRRVLPNDRQRQDQGPDRLRRVVPGLPAPGELLPARHQGRDPAHQLDQLRERGRSGDHRGLRGAQAGAEPRGGRGRLGRSGQAAQRGGPPRGVRDRQGGPAPVRADGLRQLRDDPSALQAGLLQPLPEVGCAERGGA